MKSKFGLILKTHLIHTYKLKRMTSKKLLLFLGLFFYVSVSIFMMLREFFDNIYKMLLEMNFVSTYFVILFLIASLFSFFFTIFSAKNSLFENKDNDLLFSLPVSRKTILFTRLLEIIIYNFILSIFIIIPGIIVYYSYESFSILSFGVVLVYTLFSSVIPTILASLFGYVIAFITSKSKHKNRIEFVSYLVFIGGYFLVVSQGNTIIKELLKNPHLFMNLLKILFFPIYLIYLCMTKSNFLYLIFYIILNGIILFLFVYLFNRVYYKIIVQLRVEKTSTSFHGKVGRVHDPLVALVRKEVKRYFSSAIYVFNTSFGMILLLIAGVSSLFYSSHELLSIVGNDMYLDGHGMVFYLLLFAIGFSATTNSSISIERNNFWILKMIPISVKKIFFAKKFVNFIVIMPVVVISLVLFFLSGYITFMEVGIFLLVAFLFSFVIANFGLICNLLFPKLDAPNDTVIVKQSLSSMMGIMVPMIFVVIYIVLIMEIDLSFSVMLASTIVLFLVLAFITNVILNTWGIHQYKKLS